MKQEEGGREGRGYLAPGVFGLCLAVYLVFYLLVPSGVGMYTNSYGDEPHYMLIITSLIEDGDISLENNYAREDHRRRGFYDERLDPHLVTGRNGRLVPTHQVLPALIALPGFAVAGWRGAGITMILIVCAAALFVFLVLRRYLDEKKSALVTVFFFLTYPLFAYSHLVYPEVPALFLVAFGTWCALEFSDGKGPAYIVLAGVAAAILPHLHVKFVVLTAALCLLAVLCARTRPKALLPFFAVIAASVVVLALWTMYVYGPNLVHGLTITRGKGGVLGTGSFWGIFGLYLDRVWGLLPYAPLYFAFLAGVPFPRRRPDLVKWHVFIPFAIIAYTLVVGIFKDWHGGAAPVPRYLVPLAPLFIICAALVITGSRKRWVRVTLAVLASAQVVLTVYARIYPAAVTALPIERNQLYIYIFGDNSISSTLERVFPLFHPVSPRGILLLCCWMLLTGVLVSLRSRYLERLPGQALEPTRDG